MSATTRRDLLLAGLAVTVASRTSDALAKTPPAFRVAIAGDYENVAIQDAPWDSLGPDTEVVSFTKPLNTPAETIKALRDFDVVALMRERTPMTREVLEKLPRLKLIVFSGQMDATLDHKAAADRNIIVSRALGFGSDDDAPPESNSGGGGGPAELTMALMLACSWHIPQATDLIRKGGWVMQPEIPLKIPLAKRTLGIVGYGSIGTVVGRYAQAFGMNVTGFSRSLTDEIAAKNNVTRGDLEQTLRTADVVSIHLPLTAQTRGIVGAKEIALLKPGAILINTARGPIIDEPALIDALRSRKIAMAGFDVYSQEPLPHNHAFLKLPNVVMTPHIGYISISGMASRYKALFEVVAAYRQGVIKGRYEPGARDTAPST
jgi:phosphoglycerate dehydrogenase-like enzyme